MRIQRLPNPDAVCPLCGKGEDQGYPGICSYGLHAPGGVTWWPHSMYEYLTDDLRRPPFKGSPNPVAGHCYVASEVLYHLWGGKAAGWKSMHVNHEGVSHWYLMNQTEIIDPTASQFATPVDYSKGKGKGFLTALPSKRAMYVIRRVLVYSDLTSLTPRAMISP